MFVKSEVEALVGVGFWFPGFLMVLASCKAAVKGIPCFFSCRAKAWNLPSACACKALFAKYVEIRQVFISTLIGLVPRFCRVRVYP